MQCQHCPNYEQHEQHEQLKNWSQKDLRKNIFLLFFFLFLSKKNESPRPLIGPMIGAAGGAAGRSVDYVSAFVEGLVFNPFAIGRSAVEPATPRTPRLPSSPSSSSSRASSSSSSARVFSKNPDTSGGGIAFTPATRALPQLAPALRTSPDSRPRTKTTPAPRNTPPQATTNSTSGSVTWAPLSALCGRGSPKTYAFCKAITTQAITTQRCWTCRHSS